MAVRLAKVISVSVVEPSRFPSRKILYISASAISCQSTLIEEPVMSKHCGLGISLTNPSSMMPLQSLSLLSHTSVLPGKLLESLSSQSSSEKTPSPSISIRLLVVHSISLDNDSQPLLNTAVTVIVVVVPGRIFIKSCSDMVDELKKIPSAKMRYSCRLSMSCQSTVMEFVVIEPQVSKGAIELNPSSIIPSQLLSLPSHVSGLLGNTSGSLSSQSSSADTPSPSSSRIISLTTQLLNTGPLFG